MPPVCHGISQNYDYELNQIFFEDLALRVPDFYLDVVGRDLGLYRGGILLSAHREENIDNEGNFLSLMNAVNAMAERYGLPIIYSVS